MKLSVYSKGGVVAFTPDCCRPPLEMDHRLPDSRLCGTLALPEPAPAEWADIVEEVERDLYVFVPLERVLLLLTHAAPESR